MPVPILNQPLPRNVGPRADQPPNFFSPPILTRQSLDVWNDSLPNLNRWSTAGAAWSVVNGQAFATSGGAYSWAQRPVPLLPGQPFRYAARVRRPLNSGGGRFGQTAIYVTSDSVATVNGGNQSHLLAIGFDEGTSGPNVRTWWIDSNGTASFSSTGAINAGAGDWLLSIQGDETYICLCVMSSDGTQEFRAYTTLAALGFVPQQVGMLNIDANTSTGSSIGPIGFRQGSLAPITPATNIEDMPGGGGCFAGEAGGSGSNYAFRLGIPPGYNPAVGAPLVIYVHGFGGNPGEPADNPGMSPACRALMKRGWLVLSSHANGDAWGNQASINTVLAAWKWAASHYNVTSHILLCVSMGSMLGLLVAEGTIPFNGFMAFSPGVNLLWAWRANQNPQLGQAGQASMTAAYGLTGGEADFLTKTAGHDPVALPVNSWGTIPILLSGSGRDELADQSENSSLLYSQLLTGAGRSTQNTFLHTAQGPHSAANFMPPWVVTAFADGVLTGTFVNPNGVGAFPNPLDLEERVPNLLPPARLGPRVAGPNFPFVRPLPILTTTQALTRGASDTSLSADTAGQAWAGPRGAADTSVSTDAAVRTSPRTRGASDASLSTDAAVRASPLSRSTADTSLSTDAASRADAVARTTADTSLSTDVAARNSVDARATSDVSLSTDVAAGVRVVGRFAADTSVSTDVANRASISYSRSAADTNNSTDTATRLRTGSRSTSDISASTDAANRTEIASRAASDSSTNTDVATRATVRSRSTADTSNSADMAVAGKSAVRAAADTSNSTDTAVRASIAFVRATSDVSLSTDVASKSGTPTRSAADTSLSTDAATRSRISSRTAADTSSSTDVAIRSGVDSRSTADTSVSTDTAVRGSVFYIRSTADTSLSTDAATRPGGNGRTTADTSNSTDIASRISTRARTTADTSLSTDATSRISARARATADTSNSTDAAIRVTMRSRITSDTSNSIDSASRIGIQSRGGFDVSNSTDTAGAARVTIRSHIGMFVVGGKRSTSTATIQGHVRILVTIPVQRSFVLQAHASISVSHHPEWERSTNIEVVDTRSTLEVAPHMTILTLQE